MAIYRKNKYGQVIKVASNLIQRWNDKIFQTEHSVVTRNGQSVDLYVLEDLASKYIVNWTEYTEYQIYFDTPNTTSKIYVSYKGVEVELKLASNREIKIGLLEGKVNLYTLEFNNKIWFNDYLDSPDHYNKDEVDKIVPIITIGEIPPETIYNIHFWFDTSENQFEEEPEIIDLGEEPFDPNNPEITDLGGEPFTGENV